MGIPEYEAKRYEGRVKDGGILLSVHSDDSARTKRAKEILERSGAQDVSSTGEATAENGVMGLLLAVPLTAFIKLVADLHTSLCHLSNMPALTPATVATSVQI